MTVQLSLSLALLLSSLNQIKEGCHLLLCYQTVPLPVCQMLDETLLGVVIHHHFTLLFLHQASKRLTDREAECLRLPDPGSAMQMAYKLIGSR